MSVRVEDLETDVQEPLRSALQELGEECIPHALWCTARSQPEQTAQWVQGRYDLHLVQLLRKAAGMRPLSPSENNYTITECDGVDTPSAHQGRRATDIVALDETGRPTWNYRRYASRYKAIKAIMARHGFECGGDWMTLPNGKPSPYADVGLGWDPPHYQMKKESQVAQGEPS